MGKKAQAGLEYLMTYGWALVMVAAVVGAIVLFVGPPASVSFSSSDPTKMLLKGSAVSGNTAGLILQNATGGKIKIKSIAISGDVGIVSDTKLNGAAWPTFPVDVIAGGEIRIEGLSVSNGGANSRVVISYVDVFNFDRVVSVTSGQGGPAGLVAKYGFEEGIGTSTADGSGSGNNGALLPVGSGPTWRTTGCLSGKCLLFDGANDYVNIDGAIGGIQTGTGTWSAWLYPNNVVAKQKFLSIGDSDASSYIGFEVYSDGTLRAKATLNGANKWYVQTTGTYSTGNWIYVALVQNGTSPKIYVNGAVPAQTFSSTADPAWWADDTGYDNARIATYAPSGVQTNYFNGLIDEVKIFNRALSDFEVCSACKEHAGAVTCGC